jgi:hypothetical protein
MEPTHPTRVLVVTDHAVPSRALLEAIESRAARGPTRFRVVVPNPARAEVHLLHPERHDKAREAEAVLRDALPVLEQAAGGPLIGTVSVRHDPMDAVEGVLASEPVDEIMVAVAPHGLAARFHQDLPDRLRHLGLPVTVLPTRPVHHA